MDRRRRSLLPNPNEDIERDPEAYYRFAREAAWRLAVEQLQEEEAQREAQREAQEQHLV